MPEESKIVIEKGHVTLSGQTQCGKSYVAKNVLFPKYPKAIFYDLKHDPNHKELRNKYEVIKNVRKLKRFFKKGGTHCVYQPPHLGYDDAVNHFDTVCRFVFTTGNIALFVDEAAALSRPAKITDWYYVLITQGLSRGCNVINVTQRPTGCHNVVLSEASWFWLFRHNLESDRNKIKGFTSDDIADELDGLPPRIFIFVHPNGEWDKGTMVKKTKFKELSK